MALLSTAHLNQIEQWIEKAAQYDHVPENIIRDLGYALAMARCAELGMNYERAFTPALFDNPGPYPQAEADDLNAKLVAAGAAPRP